MYYIVACLELYMCVQFDENYEMNIILQLFSLSSLSLSLFFCLCLSVCLSLCLCLSMQIYVDLEGFYKQLSQAELVPKTEHEYKDLDTSNKGVGLLSSILHRSRFLHQTICQNWFDSNTKLTLEIDTQTEKIQKQRDEIERNVKWKVAKERALLKKLHDRLKCRNVGQFWESWSKHLHEHKTFKAKSRKLKDRLQGRNVQQYFQCWQEEIVHIRENDLQIRMKAEEDAIKSREREENKKLQLEQEEAEALRHEQLRKDEEAQAEEAANSKDDMVRKRNGLYKINGARSALYGTRKHFEEGLDRYI